MIKQFIPAKETIYNGYRFRSRLEARWAVFFDTLGIEYEYEKEGFDLSYLLAEDYGWTDGGAPGEDVDSMVRDWRRVLGSGPASYLPDFWLPHLSAWIEIKGQEPTVQEEALASMLAWHTYNDVFVFFGNIIVPAGYGTVGTESNKHFAGCGWDSPYYWCECPACGLLGIQFDARADRLPCKRVDCPGDGDRRDRGHNGNSARLIAAYTAARQSRFEHGEHGRRK